MPGTMSKADLIADLKASLQDMANVFTTADDADFVRHLSVAALDMGRKRPRTLLGSLTLVADQFNYAAPADFHSFKSYLWGIGRANPWEKTYTGRLPDVRAAVNGSTRELHLLPAPTQSQINQLGSAFKYYYFASHSIGETAADTTIQAADRGLLLLRAQAEACKEMAMRNIGKPVQMRDGITQGPRNGTPASLYDALMKYFEGTA
ncbi:MAG TPA: hypothetical protein VK149_03465 [Sideroxyarcus sp.]|nr:hypothetical protein [Sideroxyarcus sp.]